MLSRLKFLLFVPLFLLSIASANAQDIDYLKHGKTFDLCSFKKQCSECYTCTENRYMVKIKNKGDKKIKSVSYKFYSEVFNRVIEKEAKVQGNEIDPGQVGLFYICVPQGNHWVISKLVYIAPSFGDDIEVNFVLHDRLESFIQEPDECECND